MNRFVNPSSHTWFIVAIGICSTAIGCGGGGETLSETTPEPLPWRQQIDNVALLGEGDGYFTPFDLAQPADYESWSWDGWELRFPGALTNCFESPVSTPFTVEVHRVLNDMTKIPVAGTTFFQDCAEEFHLHEIQFTSVPATFEISFKVGDDFAFLMSDLDTDPSAAKIDYLLTFDCRRVPKNPELDEGTPSPPQTISGLMVIK